MYFDETQNAIFASNQFISSLDINTDWKTIHPALIKGYTNGIKIFCGIQTLYFIEQCVLVFAISFFKANNSNNPVRM